MSHIQRRRLFKDNSISATPRESESEFDPLLSSSPTRHPIAVAFERLQELTGGSLSVISHTEILYNPESQFDKIVQKTKEYLTEVECAIPRLKKASSTKQENDVDLIFIERQVEGTVAEATRIANYLQKYLDEAIIRNAQDGGTLSPRMGGGLKANESSLSDLTKMIKACKKNLQMAVTVRQRKDLFNEWSPFDRSTRRVRDAEEIMSDSTERLMNSKRILHETIQASSITLGSLATSSQSIQKNDEELTSQASMVSSARSLLKKYGRRASTDKISIWLGFIFFVFCVLFVAYRRLF